MIDTEHRYLTLKVVSDELPPPAQENIAAEGRSDESNHATEEEMDDDVLPDSPSFLTPAPPRESDKIDTEKKQRIQKNIMSQQKRATIRLQNFFTES